MGLKDVRVLHLARHGPLVVLTIEQVLGQVRCPACGGPAQVKERPVVTYSDLPVYGVPMRLAWRKHRMRCGASGCQKKTWVLEDHRIAAKSCLLTTRAAKWATVQVGTGRTVSEVAAELACDWHTSYRAANLGRSLGGRQAGLKRAGETTALWTFLSRGASQAKGVPTAGTTPASATIRLCPAPTKPVPPPERPRVPGHGGPS